jgi:Flp pilus assembly protein TadG
VAGVVDYVGTDTAASKLQNSLDATAFAIAVKYPTGTTDANAKLFGSSFFGANVRSVGLTYDNVGMSLDQVSQFDAQATSSGSGVNVSVTAKVVHRGFLGGTST